MELGGSNTSLGTNLDSELSQTDSRQQLLDHLPMLGTVKGNYR